MKKARIAALIAVVLLPALSLRAQKHPNLELGFNPDRLYQFSEIDSVNLFNGNLILQLPIGPAYSANASFKYQLTLHYNSKVWDYVKDQVYVPPEDTTDYIYAEPNWRSNSGVGWRLSLGRLLEPLEGVSMWNDTIMWKYEDASGGEHLFGPGNRDLTAQNFNDDEVLVTRDQAALRMIKVSGSVRLIEFPSGETHRFELERGRWHLRKISDRFDNYLSIVTIWRSANAADGREAEWELSDSTGRHHRVTFEYYGSTAESFDQGQHVATIEIASPALAGVGHAEGVSTYVFGYEDTTVAWGCGHFPAPGWGGAATASLPLLTSITLPDQTKFEFSYFTAGTDGSCSQGALKKITLPTKGLIEYEYQRLYLPESFCYPPEFHRLNTGVRRKRVTSQGNAAVTDYLFTLAPETDYDRDEAAEACGVFIPVPGGPPSPAPQELHRWSRGTVLSPAVNGKRARNDSYFYTWPKLFAPPDPWNPFIGATTDHVVEFGQPITTGAPPTATSGEVVDVNASYPRGGDTHYLSTRSFEGCTDTETTDCSTGRLLRSTYLEVPGDAGYGSSLYPVESTVTTYDDNDGHDGPAPADLCGGVCLIQVKNSDVDGVHKYRASTTTTTFPGGGGFSTYTAYRLWTNAMLAQKSNAWLLNLYDRTERTENGQTAVSEYCWKVDGFLEGVRMRGNSTTRLDDDLLTRRTSDGKGNVEYELNYGGRANDVLTSTACPATGMILQYSSRNTYSSGLLAKSEACDPAVTSGCSPILTNVDVDIHLSGAPQAARDASGVPTTYLYDQYGRLEQVVSPGPVTAKYSYTAATANADASVQETVRDASSVKLTESSYEFDGLGRMFRVTKSMPGQKTASVETEFDLMGRKSKTFQPYDPASTIRHWTTTTYDTLGRPVLVQSPDGKTATFTYRGDRLMTRTSAVATSTSALETPATVTEQYDAQRRLWKVTENGGITSVQSPLGSPVSTTYRYDVGGRLTEVKTGSGAPQASRTFQYDLRGMLLSELHPESGVTSYVDPDVPSVAGYDARGHFRKMTNGGKTLQYTYDAAERLTTVQDGTRVLKRFDFATANADANDYQKGKLIAAVRTNDLAYAGRIDVTESYEYKNVQAKNPAGQLSKRTTLVEQVGSNEQRNTIQSFAHTIDYDALRLPKTIGMPTCVVGNCGTAQGLTTVGFVRDAGYLTSVGSFGTLAYHPSGMVASVTHLATGPAAMDTYESTYEIARPSMIKLAGATACPAPSSSDITVADTICPGATGTASVPNRPGITHEWSITGGTITSASNGETITFLGTGTVTLAVQASNACGQASSSRSVAVSSNPPAPVIAAPSSVCASSTGNAASVPATAGITYSWQISGGSFTSATTGTNVTFTAGNSQVILTVTATSSCGGTSSATRTVSIASAPTARLYVDGMTSPITVVRGTGTSIQLQVELSGAPPWEVVWKDDHVDITSQSPLIRTIIPEGNSEYGVWSVRSGSCSGTVLGAGYYVYVVPPPPSWVSATTQPDGRVLVTWGAVPGAASYRIERALTFGGATESYDSIAGPATSYFDILPSTPSGPVTYVYYARAVDPSSTGGGTSLRAAFDHATGGKTLWTQQITQYVTVVRGNDLQELRQAVDAFRVAAGMAKAFSSSATPTGPITAANLTALITAFDQARAGKYPPFAYTPGIPPPAPGGPILRAHIQQLREALH